MQNTQHSNQKEYLGWHEKIPEFDTTEKPAVEHKSVTKTSDKIGSCTKEQDENHTCFFYQG
ncbi:hypothetical protein [Mariniphaga sediminis]|uniref:hypothetical protein n=1 Tax=Mariniphaga sediminis TaxID=1628158 RepID=UPI00356656AD